VKNVKISAIFCSYLYQVLDSVLYLWNFGVYSFTFLEALEIFGTDGGGILMASL